MRNWKKIISLIVTVAFAVGTAYVPVGFEIVHATDEKTVSGDYVEGQVIVGYIDTDDMDLTVKQEKKSDKLLGDSEELMVCEGVAVEDVDVDESKLSDEVVEEETVDETLALVKSKTKSTDELIDEIENLPNVDYVEPNFIMKADIAEEDSIEEGETEEILPEKEETEEELISLETDSKSYTDSQWAYNKKKNPDYGINLPEWNVSGKETAGDTVVAVIDTGIDYDHEDLVNSIWSKTNDPKGSKLSDFGEYGINTSGDSISGNTDDTYGHGTHCAGIIAADWNGKGVSGAVSGTKVMAIKVSNDESFNTTDIVEGYNYIIQAKEAGVNVVAINNSWGGGASSVDSLVAAVTNAGEKGIVSVFSSGNDKRNCDDEYTFTSSKGKQFKGHYIPYFLRNNKYKVIVNSNTSTGTKSSFSNYGKTTTDVFAPGSDICSTLPYTKEADSKYGNKNGTSMAAPAVTGVAALLAANMKNASASQIASAIKSGVTTVSVLSETCAFGGIVNASAALAECRNIKEYDFALSQDSFVYDGTQKKPEVASYGFSEGADYTVKYVNKATEDEDNCIEPGTYKVVITGTGRYSGTVEKDFSIQKATPNVSLSGTYFTYDGGNKGVSVSVTGVQGKKLANGKDYAVGGQTVGNMPGYYRVHVTMKDSVHYNDSYADFRIGPQTTYVKKLSRAKKAFTVKVAKMPKNLVNGYQVRYSLYGNMAGAKTKTIGTKYNKISKKVSGIKGKSAYYVQVRAYKTIGKTKYYSDWSRIYTVQTK